MVIEAIVFDAMETIVDIAPLPDDLDRARWLYEAVPALASQLPLSQLHIIFRRARMRCCECWALGREYTTHELMTLVVDALPATIGQHHGEKARLVQQLMQGYERGYFTRCRVTEETAAVLAALGQEYRLAILSNHIIKDGLQRFLAAQGVLAHVHLCLTSADLGYRKPHPLIYEQALAQLGLSPEAVLFIGDNYIHDVQTPRQLGMQALQYTPGQPSSQTDSVLGTLSELPELLSRCFLQG